MYDYFLGGTHNYTVDRVKADQILKLVPGIREAARDNRQFLKRAVEFCMQAGIRQFLDLGSGIPTSGNVHQVAHAIDPATRVVYVDNDHEAVVTSQELLKSVPTATIIGADMLDSDSVLSQPDTLRLIDFTKPVGLLMVAVLHFVPLERNAHEVVQAYINSLPSGSYLALSHAAREQQGQYEHLYNDTSNPVTLRTRQEVTEFFGGFNIMQPGVVMTREWRPSELSQQEPSPFGNWAAVGVKP